MARTLTELAREALAVQDACNVSGVAVSFGRAMCDLRDHVPGSQESAAHPVTAVWLDKLCDLAGIDHACPGNAFQAVHALAEGR